MAGDDDSSENGENSIADLMQGLQALSGAQGTSTHDLQNLVSALGGQVKSGLRQITDAPTAESAEQIVEQIASQQEASPDMLSKIFSGQEPSQIAATASQKTGLGSDKIMAMLPVVLPMVMKFLQSKGNGTSQKSQLSGSGSDSLLTSFLDSDNDGDVDLQDVMKLASKFL